VNVWSRACVPVTHFHERLPPTVQHHHTARRPRMLHIAYLQIVHRLHRLIPTGHEAMTFGERTAWLPFALVMPLSLLRTFAQTACYRKHIIDVTAIGVLRILLSLSTLTHFRNTCFGPGLPRGAAVCTATATVNAWNIFFYYLSILLGPMVALCRNVYRASPWIQRSPTFCPWPVVEGERGAETKKKPCHPRSRGIGSTQLPETGLLSLGKPCLKLLSFYP
jgi:hypothetical protein